MDDSHYSRIYQDKNRGNVTITFASLRDSNMMQQWIEGLREEYLGYKDEAFEAGYVAGVRECRRVTGVKDDG